ncbi:hypothetical protein CBR_g2998 [Chara braunii]|uniref:Uncharacterized protein n=1 Tax=Chara braunii TaxID=69332 RepID=A0A388KEG8_CHABU|nr:hypothetical protein CBR_g2998 [Chara braunii]|eukprot:GBG68454.1 hypothetical protein CBR_g2998 [Chara braunii]
MADVFRRLPLLVLVVLLLLLVVLFHVCVVGIVPRRGRRRRCAKKDVSVDGRQAVCRSAGGEGGGQRAGQSPCRGSRAVERSEYAHLPPHLQPLLDTSDEEEDDRRSRAAGSGSTQEWTATKLCGSREPCYGQSYTQLLQQGLSGDEGDGGVNLTFGLWSGRSLSSTRTVLVNNRPDDNGGQVTAVARPSKSPASSVCVASGNNRDHCVQQYRAPSASRGASARPSWMLSPSPLSAKSSAARNRGECGEHDCGIEERRDARDRRERLRVVDDENDGDAPDVAGTYQDLNDDDCGGGEDDAGQVSPSKQSSMGGKGGRAKASVRNGRRGKKPTGKGSDVEADGDVEGGRHFWSIDDMVALIRAKRDQDAHLQGMGTAYARMKPREWKWLDVEQRLRKFIGKERLSKGFSFNMDRAVYDEILGSTAKSHTINPKNVANTLAPGGVRPPSANSSDPESVGDRDAAAGLDDDDEGSTRGSSQMTVGPAGFIKRKSTRQRTFDALSECMEKHEALVVSTMESNSKRQCSIQIRQCEALEAEEEVQKKHYAPSDEDDRGASTMVAARGAEVPKAGAATAGGASQAGEGGRSGGAATVGASHAVEGARAGGGDAGEGSTAGAVAGVGEDNEVVANRPPAIRHSIVLPHTTIPQHKIEDESEFSAAQDRALKVQTIALRVIHGWVFKSASRQRGYHVAYGYALNHAATNIARAIWMGEDWRVCVSPMVFHTTLNMDMKLPLWFVGAHIEDRHEDDELAADEEASVQRLVGAFTSAVSTAEGVDGGWVSHERLKSVAEAMRVMLAATMWLMRMGGDDRRAHYDAWVFVQLTAKAALIAFMHRSFDVRRHIVQASTTITDKLAKPPITLLAPPMYIPDWASIGMKFSHDATLSSPMEAQKLDWLGTGPPEDDDDAAVNDDMSAGGS